MRETTRPFLGRPFMLAAALCSLLLVTAAHAGEAAKPEDQWWKKAKPPKRRPPVTWCVGGFFGMQNWTGLKDYAPSEAERSQGWRGAFDTTSPIFGVVGYFELKRYGTVNVGLDVGLDAFSNETSELSVQPMGGTAGDESHFVKLQVWRLGLAGRAIFRSASRVQPTAALGVAFASHSFDGYAIKPPSPPTPGRQYSWSGSLQLSADFIVSGGLDVALQEDVRRGWRLRFEAGVEYRTFDDELPGFGDKTAGPLAYRAQVGVLYRFEPKPTSP